MTTVHSLEEIEAMLRRGLCPVTDNREALHTLGFDRAYPQARHGHDATVWERSVDSGRSTHGRRALARERAYLKS